MQRKKAVEFFLPHSIRFGHGLSEEVEAGRGGEGGGGGGGRTGRAGAGWGLTGTSLMTELTDQCNQWKTLGEKGLSFSKREMKQNNQ